MLCILAALNLSKPQSMSLVVPPSVLSVTSKALEIEDQDHTGMTVVLVFLK